MPLDPSNSSKLEQLALKGLIVYKILQIFDKDVERIFICNPHFVV